MASQKPRQTRWYAAFDLAFRWTLATTAGWMIWTTGVGAIFLAPLLWFPLLFSGTVPGITIGLFQWLILRKHVRNASTWLLASILGSVLSWMLIGAHFWDVEAGAVIGATIGICQMFVLARWKWQATPWALACLVGWTVSWAFDNGHVLARSVAPIWDRAALAGVTLGLITGSAIAWLIDQAQSRADQAM